MISVWRFNLAVVTFMVAMSGCGNGGDQNPGVEPSGAAATAPSAFDCPTQESISAAIGAEVIRQPYGGQCFYQDEDADNAVVIMHVWAGTVDQVEQDLAESASDHGVPMESVEVGEKARTWAQAGVAQGYVLSGEDCFLVDIQTPGQASAPKDGLVRIFKMIVP